MNEIEEFDAAQANAERLLDTSRPGEIRDPERRVESAAVSPVRRKEEPREETKKMKASLVRNSVNPALMLNQELPKMPPMNMGRVLEIEEMKAFSHRMSEDDPKEPKGAVHVEDTKDNEEDDDDRLEIDMKDLEEV